MNSEILLAISLMIISITMWSLLPMVARNLEIRGISSEAACSAALPDDPHGICGVWDSINNTCFVGTKDLNNKCIRNIRYPLYIQFIGSIVLFLISLVLLVQGLKKLMM